MATTGSMQIVQADHKTGHEYGSGPGTPAGQPYGQLVAEEAQKDDNTDKGFGDDIKGLCEKGTCGGSHQGLGDYRASDEADISPGKSQDNRDESAGNDDN
jgi:hypothetical protein